MSARPFEMLHQRLKRLDNQALKDRLLGIEKESLRVQPDGHLAATPHPAGLGSALTHPFITTDYSEALLELVTPPVPGSWQALQCLVDLHQFVYGQIGDEVLWATSMPCRVSHDDDVPIANFGTSNVGRMKHVYRVGLGHRYGRKMQAISGVHFNFSVGDSFWQQLLGGSIGTEQVSDQYFGLLRNFRRFGWLTLYLFGASPAACRNFLGDTSQMLENVDATAFGEYATTLRMSDVGYKNKVQSRLEIPVNCMREYIDGLTRATETPYEPYEKIGVVVDGEYRQLNANILQIENEYYSLIRPKRVARSGEKPTHALARGGVQYVEVRALDVSPFDPAGINQAEIRFLELFLVFCLLHDSPAIDEAEQKQIDLNQLSVAREGRTPGLTLSRGPQQVLLRDWALEITDQLYQIADLFDDPCYRQALDLQVAAINQPMLTPSARVLEEMRANKESFFEFALRMSTTHSQYFHELAGISQGKHEQLAAMALDSLQKQKELEADSSQSFDDFLAKYFAQQL